MEDKSIDCRKELEGAMASLRDLLAKAQVTTGVIETMLWMMKKEENKEEKRGGLNG